MAKRHPAQDFFASRLAASGVTEEQARLSGIVPATRDEALRLYKKLTANITDLGMLIRYPDQPNACRYRCNWERKPKYLQPKGSGSLLFFPKVKELDWEKVLNGFGSAVRKPDGTVEGTYEATAAFTLFVDGAARVYKAGAQLNMRWYPGFVAIAPDKNSSPTEFFALSKIAGVVFQPETRKSN